MSKSTLTDNLELVYGSEEDLSIILDAEKDINSSEEYVDLLKLYGEKGLLQDIEVNKIIKGRVLKLTKNEVFVDINFKSEGVIPLHEFKNPEEIEAGQEIEVFLEEIENNNGQIILSKSRADFIKVWDDIKVLHDDEQIVTGSVVRKIKGGLVVNVLGVDAFLPGSQIDLRQIPNLDDQIGKEYEVKIIKVNKARRNIVVSRRAVLEQDRIEMRSSIIETIQKGQVRKGRVKNITDFGVFIDLGGVDGLLHITDMSWSRISHPKEMVELDNEIDVMILDYDEEKTRISLGLKQMTPHPWEGIEETYSEGTKTKGKITNITDYGAFMELQKGIEGLIHISEMSWTKNIRHPSQILSVGDEVEAMVLKLDVSEKKISLGIKQILENPWDNIEEKFPINTVVKGEVRNLTTFGAFVGLEEGIDGLVHVSDISWTQKVKHPSDVLNKGDEVEAKVIALDTEKRRISLSIKHMAVDPWMTLSSKYGVGAETKGVIARMLDRGVMVTLPDEIEGFVPTNQLGKGEISKASDAFKEGEEIPLKVIEFDSENRKITLSVEEYFSSREAAELEDYRSKHVESATTLGDVSEELKEKIESSDEESAE